jgi:hypothetical protein
MEKGLYPLSPWERVRVRAAPCPYPAFLAKSTKFR